MKLRRSKQKPSILMDVVRSFTYKANIAGHFESRDFFCSYKCQAREEDAKAASRFAIKFCKEEVMTDVREWNAERREQIARKKAASSGRKLEEAQA